MTEMTRWDVSAKVMIGRIDGLSMHAEVWQRDSTWWDWRIVDGGRTVESRHAYAKKAEAIQAAHEKMLELAGRPRESAGEVHADAIVLATTDRGFKRGEFEDVMYETCTIQESSLATEPCIWLGIDRFDRMHLTRPMVAALLPHLRRFVETGEL